MAKKIKAIEGQSMLDIALQETGSIEGVVQLSIKNGRTITGAISREEYITKGDVIDRSIHNYFDTRKIISSTDVSKDKGYQIFVPIFEDIFE